MKGYKYLKDGMTAPFNDDFYYEMDKWYEVEDESKVEMCKCGFHFFATLRDLFNYAFYNNEDIYEIEADGKMVSDTFIITKYCSSKIRVVKKLEKEDFIRIAKEENLLSVPEITPCICLINKALFHDELIHHKSCGVRCVLAQHGYGLDKLVNDEDWHVRVAVARQGYGLDKLVHDKKAEVRYECACRGYGLDILINDPEPYVRMQVANHAYGLDQLINDPDPYISALAYKIKNSLDHLISDDGDEFME